MIGRSGEGLIHHLLRSLRISANSYGRISVVAGRRDTHRYHHFCRHASAIRAPLRHDIGPFETLSNIRVNVCYQESRHSARFSYYGKLRDILVTMLKTSLQIWGLISNQDLNYSIAWATNSSKKADAKHFTFAGFRRPPALLEMNFLQTKWGRRVMSVKFREK